MLKFERSDTLFIRCAPELKQAIEILRSRWNVDSVSDVIHTAIAHEFRSVNINAEMFGKGVDMSDEDIQRFAQDLGEKEHRAQERERLKRFERSQLRELKKKTKH